MSTSYNVLEKQGVTLALNEGSSQFDVSLAFGESERGGTLAYLDINVTLSPAEVIDMALEMIQAALYHEPDLHDAAVKRVRDMEL